VVAVRRLNTQALGVRWAIRAMYDTLRAGMAPQYYTIHRTGLNLEWRGETLIYIKIITQFWLKLAGGVST
jgi:hypothetical protein